MSIKQPNPKELLRLIIIISILGSVSTSIIINTNSATNLVQPTGTINGRICNGECEIIPTPTPEPTITPTPEPTSTPIPEPTQNETVIAYFGDVEPSSESDVLELTKDLNQVIPLSPNGKIDAVFFMGDMTKDTGTFQLTLDALSTSILNNTSAYFVVGNHEYNSRSSTYPLIRNKQSAYSTSLNYFTFDTQNLTFTVDINNIHLVNMNEYWDNSNGDVTTQLYNWINEDLSNTSKYKIVLGHEPLYPLGYHEGNSLDAYPENRDRLQNLLVSENVSVFIGGHVHYASVQNIDNIYHVCTGVIGDGTSQGEDDFATITYTYSNETNLTLVMKSENPTWGTPKVTTYII